MATIFEKLANPLPPAKVSWRIGQIAKKDPQKASALCYIDARDVMARLDEVVGPENWEDTYEETAKGRILCTIAIRHDGRWIKKTDAAGDTQVEAEKGAVSDAFKRAAVKWGIGRYLYDIPMQWVQIDQYRQILKSEHPKLQRALPGSRVYSDDEDGHSEPQTPKEDKPAQLPSTDKPPAQRKNYAVVATSKEEFLDGLLKHLQAVTSADEIQWVQDDNINGIKRLPRPDYEVLQKAVGVAMDRLHTKAAAE